MIEDLFGEDYSDVDEESPKPIHPLRELVQLLEQDEKRRFWFACQDETLFQVNLNDEKWFDEATIFVQALLKKARTVNSRFSSIAQVAVSQHYEI